MPGIAVKLYSFFFKYHLKQQLQRLSETQLDPSKSNTFGVTSRPEEGRLVPAIPTFQNGGVATKDIHVDPVSALSLRIFLPDSVVGGGGGGSKKPTGYDAGVVYKGYSPAPTGKRHRKLPVMLQFHGGMFVSGSNESAANDAFCRRMARLCDVIVVAVGYRLAPESLYPAAFEDGLKALNWLGKQANLASLQSARNVDVNGRIFDSFGASTAEPWLAAHGDPSRYYAHPYSSS